MGMWHRDAARGRDTGMRHGDAVPAKSIPCQATFRCQILPSHTQTLNTSLPLFKVLHTQTSYSLQLMPRI